MSRTVMLDPKAMEKRIGQLQKSDKIAHLVPVEEELLEIMDRYRVDTVYDVVADELPFFKTLGYTEWAGNLIVYPLCLELREEQIRQAILDNITEGLSLSEYLRHQIESGNANKYKNRKKLDEPEYRDNLVVLLGSNKIKKHVCLNKLQWIADRHGDAVWFKPHPITKWSIIGELIDMFGERRVLHRDADLYDFLVHAKVVYTTHHSESVAFSVALGLEISPIDVYNTRKYGAFSHINARLFESTDPMETLDLMFRSPKSGIFNPDIQEDWKKRLREYVEYIMDLRERFKYYYIGSERKHPDPASGGKKGAK